jgi:chromosome segregation ATPase
VQAVVDRLTAAAEEGTRSQARLDMRLKGLADQAAQAAHADSERTREAELDTLQAALDAVRSEATTAAASAAAGGERLAAVEDRVLRLPDAIAELAGIQEQMSLRLDVLAERVARPAVEDESSLEAVERRLRDDLAARQTEIGRAVAAVAAVAEAGTRRVDSVEERIGRSGDELSEVTELQAALDEGLGELRAQLADLDEQEADATAGVMARVEALERRVEESLRGRRAPAGATLAQDSRLSRTFGRASAEVAAELSALSEAAGSLVWRHDQLEMRMGMVEQARDEATRSVQGQLAALHKQLTAQHQALLALTETVEGLRPKKAAGRTTKATKATKGPKV